MARLKDQPEKIRDAVKRMPDSLFDGDEQVKEYRRRIAEARERHRIASDELQQVLALVNVDERRAELEAEIERANAERKAAAFEDLKSGDLSFNNALLGRLKVQKLQWQLEALNDALEHLRASGVESALRQRTGRAGEDEVDARIRLNERLEFLKIERAKRN